MGKQDGVCYAIRCKYLQKKKRKRVSFRITRFINCHLFVFLFVYLKDLFITFICKHENTKTRNEKNATREQNRRDSKTRRRKKTKKKEI